MKYLIVILVVVAAAWLLLRRRTPERRARRDASQPGTSPLAMVQCVHCGVHLPRGDAVEDRLGVFCSEAHRLAGPSSP
jgi:uncharacterized protein